MKLKKLLIAMTISQIISSCGKKENKNSFVKNETKNERPQENINDPKLDKENESNILPNKDPKNLFLRYCSNDGKYFNNCDFKDLFIKYNENHDNEMKYIIKYEFKDCNFDKLNIGINSNNHSIKITDGIETLNLKGYKLVFRDIYEWDTKTNEYDLSCFFNIENVETSFSTRADS